MTENPVKGQPLNPDDPRLRTLEAYIISQRNGTARRNVRLCHNA